MAIGTVLSYSPSKVSANTLKKMATSELSGRGGLATILGGPVMNSEVGALNWIQEWFRNNCNGDWEHDQKIIITNLDNPGWCLAVKLDETDLEGKEFNSFFIERSENDWIACRVENNQFLGDGGVYNLTEILEIFKSWATSNHTNDTFNR